MEIHLVGSQLVEIPAAHPLPAGSMDAENLNFLVSSFARPGKGGNPGGNPWKSTSQ